MEMRSSSRRSDSRPTVSPEMSRKSALPKRLQPMLATLTDAPFDDSDWVFEDNYDGFRMVSEIRGGKVALFSRNGIDLKSVVAAVTGAGGRHMRDLNGNIGCGRQNFI